jgi:hypothetical protein
MPAAYSPTGFDQSDEKFSFQVPHNPYSSDYPFKINVGSK